MTALTVDAVAPCCPQAGFLEFVAQPLLHAWTTFAKHNELMVQLQENINWWRTRDAAGMYQTRDAAGGSRTELVSAT